MDVDTDAIPPTSAAAASQLHPLSVVDNERRCVSYRQILTDILQGLNDGVFISYFLYFIIYQSSNMASR
mgnify:FL=1